MLPLVRVRFFHDGEVVDRIPMRLATLPNKVIYLDWFSEKSDLLPVQKFRSGLLESRILCLFHDKNSTEFRALKYVHRYATYEYVVKNFSVFRVTLFKCFAEQHWQNTSKLLTVVALNYYLFTYVCVIEINMRMWNWARNNYKTRINIVLCLEIQQDRYKWHRFLYWCIYSSLQLHFYTRSNVSQYSLEIPYYI